MALLCGTLLDPVSETECRVVPNAGICIGEDGRIAEVRSGVSAAGCDGGGPDCWILPGFVDAHLHLPQWDRRGLDGYSVSQWRQNVGVPAEIRLRDRSAAVQLAEDFASGLIANGTTTFAAFGSPFAEEVDQSFQVFARRGLRAIYGMTLNDVGMPEELMQPTDAALDQSRQLCARWHGAENGRLQYALSPRASVRCSEKLMRGTAALSDILKCYIQTHIAESLEELAEVHEMYSKNVDEVEVFEEAGLLGSRTLLAHGVFLDRQQRRQVARRGSAVVHCPTGNLFRESGLMDYVAHREDGIRIALGSSVAGGPDPFMPRVAVESLHTAKAIKVHTVPRRSREVPLPAEAWYMLTKGGAVALGIADRVGSIAPGFQADCLVVRPEKWIADLPPNHQISALLYTLCPQQILDVFVAGRRLKP